MREENDKQLELLQSSRKALAELRNRYDQGVSSWNMEREALEKKAKEVSSCIHGQVKATSARKIKTYVYINKRQIATSEKASVT